MTFNGHTHKEFVPQKTAAYVSQYDLHTGQLTVRETLNFAAHVQGIGSQYGAYISLPPDYEIELKSYMSISLPPRHLIKNEMLYTTCLR